jgi:large subunit ribosomal protein L6
MSRIGRTPITVPEKVKVDIRPDAIEVQGPLGKFVQKLPRGIAVKAEKNLLKVEIIDSADEGGGSRHGLTRSLVQNAIIGVTQGFKKELEIIGLGYRANVAGDKLTISLGFAHPKVFKVPAGIKVSVDPKQTLLAISGVDAYLVGEVTAQIRRLRLPEPYKGSGIKYVGEHIKRKAGKAAAGAVGAAGGAK